MSRDFAKELGQAGCRQVQIGVESGSPYLRNEIINKGLSDQEITDAVETLRGQGIHVKVYAMMGLPEETRWRYRESVQNLARYEPDMIQIQVWEPHEGSDLLDKDPEASKRAFKHYHPGHDKQLWRIKFYFKYFHRYVALYTACDRLRKRRPIAARMLRWLVDASILFPWAPECLLSTSWEGRRRWPAALFESRAWNWLARRFAPLFKDVACLENRLAAVHLQGGKPSQPRPPAAVSIGLESSRVAARS